MTFDELGKRAADAETKLWLRGGVRVVVQGCDESEEEAIARAGAEHWPGAIIIVRRFSLTAAECTSALLDCPSTVAGDRQSQDYLEPVLRTADSGQDG